MTRFYTSNNLFLTSKKLQLYESENVKQFKVSFNCLCRVDCPFIYMPLYTDSTNIIVENFVILILHKHLFQFTQLRGLFVPWGQAFLYWHSSWLVHPWEELELTWDTHKQWPRKMIRLHFCYLVYLSLGNSNGHFEHFQTKTAWHFSTTTFAWCCHFLCVCTHTHTHMRMYAHTSTNMYISPSYENTSNLYVTYTVLSSRCLRSSSAQFWASIFSFTIILLASLRALSLSCKSPITHPNFCISETGLNTPHHT